MRLALLFAFGSLAVTLIELNHIHLFQMIHFVLLLLIKCIQLEVNQRIVLNISSLSFPRPLINVRIAAVKRSLNRTVVSCVPIAGRVLDLYSVSH